MTAGYGEETRKPHEIYNINEFKEDVHIYQSYNSKKCVNEL